MQNFESFRNSTIFQLALFDGSIESQIQSIQENGTFYQKMFVISIPFAITFIQINIAGIVKVTEP